MAVLCPASVAVILRIPSQATALLCLPPSLLGWSQNLKAADLSEKARKTAGSSSPEGQFQHSLLAPDVKEQLWGWQQAQLAVEQGLEGGE